MHEYKDQGGPRWVDVADYCNEVGRAHGGSVRFSMGSDVVKRTGHYLWISVEFWPKNQKGTRYFTASKNANWPNIDHKKMPSLLVKLILELDFELTQRQIQTEAQAHF